MIVVADTTPLNYLILLGRIDLLRSLFGAIVVPYAVRDEMLHADAPPKVRDWAMNPPAWVKFLPPSQAGILQMPRLGRGEADAITLAEELRADWLLIDEAAGRDEAARRGLQTIGTLGILREAHLSGRLDFRDTVHRLRQLGFRVSRSLVDRLIASLDNQP